MKKNIFLFISLVMVLMCLVGCSAEKEISDKGSSISQPQASNTNDIVTDKEIPNSQYQEILESISLKCQDINSGLDLKQGVLYDIDHDGQDELVLLYEYPENYITFEIWTLQDNVAVQLAAISDLPSIAGNGFGGIHVVQYEGDEYICFWIKNNESNPPGVVITFDCSLWQLVNGKFTNLYRKGVKYQLDKTGIAEVYDSYGIPLDGAMSITDCQEFMNTFFDSPRDIILRTPHDNDIYGIGIPLEKLLK